MVSHSITLIGTGNVAWHLAPALERAGHAVNALYGRSEEKAQALSRLLYDASLSENLDFGSSHSDLFIVAVTDGAIESIASEIVLPEHAAIVHTSGSVPVEVLELTACPRIGVLYPLQSFSRERPVDYSEVPLFIESPDEDFGMLLAELGQTVSKKVRSVQYEERAMLHLSAVFLNNFTNHLLTIGNRLADQHELDFELMIPLIKETFHKALEIGPAMSQTGPAVRGDHETMERHLQQLEFSEDFQMIYRTLSESISKMR